MNPNSRPLIYLLNTTTTVEKALSPTFNVSHYWMNGFQTYTPSSFTSISVPYSHVLPSNMHEAEIVVIDTALRNGLITNRNSPINIRYRHTPSYVDLFPLDMSTVLKNIFSTKKKQLLVVFCESYNDETYTVENEAGGRNQYQASTYCFPNDYRIILHQRSGSRMKVAPGDTALTMKQCIEKYLPGSCYNFMFHTYRDSQYEDIPLLLNEADEVVSFIRFMGDKIVFLLPKIDNKAAFLLELFDKVLADLSIFKDIFPNHGSFRWVKDYSYISIEERNKSIDIDEEIKRHEKNLATLKEEYENIHNKDKNVKLRNMLKETGDNLVPSVKWFLEYIGFTDVVDPDKNVDVDAGEVFEEDLNFEYNSIHFLLEVKGIGGTSTDAQCAQISKIALRRKKAFPGNTYKAVYVVNHQRYKAPKEREQIPFNENQITDAEIANRGMTFTYELFNIYHMIEVGVISKKAVREAFKQEGLIDFRNSLHKLDFNHCYSKALVYSLIIPEGSSFSVSKTDKIAVQDNENHWHLLSIEGIEIDKVAYEKVSSGNVGIKVDRLVSEARDFYVVKTSEVTEFM
ncbi:hypothetical protein ACO2E8_004198 [Yersinia enterocolitica]|nr:hypothetical protein [Yersinia enterocolitica]WET13878.1 hypothetical protein P2W49_14920 [Yersinia intermedia]